MGTTWQELIRPYRPWGTFLFFMGMSCLAFAQVDAPTFHCLNGDTLRWTLPNVTCGTFQSVSIYSSQSKEGSYVLIDNITDAGINHYIHEVPGTRFYYLTTTYSCQEPLSMPSDTLGTLQLSEVRIERLNVNVDGSVNVRWEPHPSATIIAYVIEKTLLDQGTTQVLDTVYGDLEFTDQMAQANDHPEYYRVWGLDLCGNETSYPAVPHTTIHLQDSASFCDNRILLFWDLYSGWDVPTEEYEIHLGLDGRDPQPEHIVRGNTDFLGIVNVSSDLEYCMFAVAHQVGTGITARSNTVCVVPDVLSPLSELKYDNITVEGDEIELHWNHTSQADLQNLEIQRSDNDGSSFELLKAYTDMFPGMDQNIEMDGTADPSSQAFVYRLEATDVCDTLVQSKPGSSIHAHVETSDQNTNTISWTEFDIGGRKLQSYTLCKITDQGTGNIELPIDQLQFVEAVDPNQATLEVCYLIKAAHTNSNGTDSLVANSNLACLEQKVEAYVPNAFAPFGNNRIFKPELVFSGGISEYRMLIFDRWGGKIFESRDPQNGWDGRVNGEVQPVGVYSYVIEIEQTGIEKQVIPGTVTLVR